MPHLFRLLAIFALIFPHAPTVLAAQVPTTVPEYVGSQTCANCHAVEMQDWQGSDHALAWTQPGEANILGDFNDAEYTFKGITSRFTRRDGDFFVETEAADGAMRNFKVTGVIGFDPLQQYMVETEPGRFQVLDLAWDAVAGNWYYLYPDQNLPPGDGFHWTGPYKNWNARCAECHATGFKKNYDPRTRTYDSRQAEIGVGCEACHGPGQSHVKWAEDPAGYDPTRWPGLTPLGLTIGFSADAPGTEIQQCAACHSRREPFGDGNPLPGTAYHDAYRIALLREALYEADGAIKDEVYVYGSFLQSKMKAQGVRCSDCHKPHSTDLKAEGNAVCAQCHSPDGNPRFPTLKKVEYDDPAHYFHAKDTPAAQCSACHMGARTYMQIDARSDHNFRIPRPGLSVLTGAPNTCNVCHTDRDPAWAAEQIAQRFPDTGQRGPHFSQTFAAARLNPGPSTDSLLGIAELGTLPGIVRASALDLLRTVADEAIATRVVPLIDDSDPLVRASAIALQRAALPQDRVQRIVASFEDPVKLVRIAAAREFLGAPVARMPDRIDAAARKSTVEWRASLFNKMDFPEANMVIGGTALVMRDLKAAEQAFRETVRLDPQQIDAWVMIARILAATGDMDATRAALDEAVAINPTSEYLRAFREDVSQR